MFQFNEISMQFFWFITYDSFRCLSIFIITLDGSRHFFHFFTQSILFAVQNNYNMQNWSQLQFVQKNLHHFSDLYCEKIVERKNDKLKSNLNPTFGKSKNCLVESYFLRKIFFWLMQSRKIFSNILNFWSLQDNWI